MCSKEGSKWGKVGSEEEERERKRKEERWRQDERY